MKSDDILEKLKLQVADPEWPERLLPLFMYRGATRPQRIHTLWNVAYAMYLKGCESRGDAIKTFNTIQWREYHGKQRTHWDGAPNELGHFCGLHTPLQHNVLYGMFMRLRANPQLTDSVDKGFTEYVEYMHPGPCTLVPVSQFSTATDPKKIAWWRVAREKMKRGRKPKVIVPKVKEPAWYMKDAPSYLPAQRKGFSADIALMEHIHRLVPKGMPSEIKSDLCQDLLVAVLSGETSVANLPDVVNQYARQARRLLPDRWKTVSLDALVPGTDDLRGVDNLGACHDHF